jgi:excisionase family DNA binding protein
VSATKIEPLLLRVDEAAEALALSRTKVYELMASGELESVKVGRARRVLLASLRHFVARQYEGAGRGQGLSPLAAGMPRR